MVYFFPQKLQVTQIIEYLEICKQNSQFTFREQIKIYTLQELLLRQLTKKSALP